jgi:hypothetical protein
VKAPLRPQTAPVGNNGAVVFDKATSLAILEEVKYCRSLRRNKLPERRQRRSGGGAGVAWFRITTQVNGATAPAYSSSGAGVLQKDTGSSPMTDATSTVTTGLKNANAKGLKLGAYGLFEKIGDSWWLVMPDSCGNLV